MGKIGIVTVTYNSSQVLKDFLESVLYQSLDNWILYIIDSASIDDTLEIIANYNDNRIITLPQCSNVGFAKGTNIGIKHAILDECDYVLALNNDTVFDVNLFDNLVSKLETSHVDMATPKMLFYSPSNIIWCAGGGFANFPFKNIHYGENYIDNGGYDFTKIVDFAPFCCVIFRTKLFLDNNVGMLDEKYFTYYEDADWMWRAKQLGKKLLYIHDAVLYHKVSSLTGKTSDFTVNMITRNRVYFILKHFSGVKCFWEIFLGFIYIVAGPLKNKHSLNSIPMRIESFINGIKVYFRNVNDDKIN